MLPRKLHSSRLLSYLLLTVSQGLHAAGLQDADGGEIQTRPGCDHDAHLLPAERRSSVQLRPQSHVREEPADHHVADGGRRPYAFQRQHHLQLWQQHQQQQEVRQRGANQHNQQYLFRVSSSEWADSPWGTNQLEKIYVKCFKLKWRKKSSVVFTDFFFNLILFHPQMVDWDKLLINPRD